MKWLIPVIFILVPVSAEAWEVKVKVESFDVVGVIQHLESKTSGWGNTIHLGGKGWWSKKQPEPASYNEVWHSKTMTEEICNDKGCDMYTTKKIEKYQIEGFTYLD